MKIFKSKNSFFRFIVVATTILCCAIPAILTSGVALAQNSGLEATAKAAKLSTENISIATLIGRIVYIILSFLGIIFVILLIYGGFMRMTSQGNSEKNKTANGIITSAIVGVIIILASYTITAFILGRVESAVTQDRPAANGEFLPVETGTSNSTP